MDLQVITPWPYRAIEPQWPRPAPQETGPDHGGPTRRFSIATDTDLTDDDQNIYALTGSLFWAGTSNTALTFGFIDSQADYSYTTVLSDAFNAAQQDTVRTVLDIIAAVTLVTLSGWGFGARLGTLRFAEQAATSVPNTFAPGPDEMGDGGTLTGEAQNDTRYRGAGFDSLFGGNGMDARRGGSGGDAPTGGVKCNEFQFAAGDGNDTILGFGPGKAITIGGRQS